MLRRLIFCMSFLDVLPSIPAVVPDFVEWGYCSEVPLQQDFDPLKYQGWWWDIKRVPNEYQNSFSCINSNITWTGTTMEVESRGLTPNREKSGAFAVMTKEQSREPPNQAHMTVSSEGVPEVPYQIVSTDYTSYSCVYSCLQLPWVFAEFFWIIGRQPELSIDHQNICLDKFNEAGINTDKLVYVEQGKTCPYFRHVSEKFEYNKRLLTPLIKAGHEASEATSTTEGSDQTTISPTSQPKIHSSVPAPAISPYAPSASSPASSPHAPSAPSAPSPAIPPHGASPAVQPQGPLAPSLTRSEMPMEAGNVAAVSVQSSVIVTSLLLGLVAASS